MKLFHLNNLYNVLLYKTYILFRFIIQTACIKIYLQTIILLLLMIVITNNNATAAINYRVLVLAQSVTRVNFSYISI